MGRREDPPPEDQLAKEMTHDLEMNFNKIAPSASENDGPTAPENGVFSRIRIHDGTFRQGSSASPRASSTVEDEKTHYREASEDLAS